jgi:hypothetical protein
LGIGDWPNPQSPIKKKLFKHTINSIKMFYINFQ